MSIIDTFALDNYLSKLSNNLTNQQVFLEKVGKTITETIALRFVDEQDPYNQRWQELSEFTKKLRERKGPVITILTDFGFLAKSITYKVNSSAIEFGTNIAYAKTHQYGSSSPKVPKRPFLPEKTRGLPEDWKNDIERVFKAMFKA